jgi:hypothetical protein
MNIERILGLTVFFGLIFCVILLFKIHPGLTTFIGLTLTFLLFILSWFTFHPIDTYTLPVDKSTLSIFPDGKKLIVRQYKNAKTNRQIQDTVLVKDVFIFRQQFDRNK